MARVRDDQPLLPSVLDRLLDFDPTNHREAPQTRAQVLRELKLSVCRDLENLLNTRWRCRELPKDLEELPKSLVNYGIPDFTGSNMTQASDREKLRQTIERTIRQFEPRFKSVKVAMIANRDAWDRTLRFRIDGLLHAEPAPEPVVYDSQLEPTSATFAVRTPNA